MVMPDVSLDDATWSFEIYCRAKGLARSTLATYAFALRCLREYLGDGGRLARIPCRDELRAFVAHMLDRGLSRQTIRIRLRSIRVFCNYLVREGLVTESPMCEVEMPRVPAAMPDILSAAEARELLRAAKTQSWHGTRNFALVATLLDTGVRLGEVIALDISDVDIAQMTMRVRNGKGTKDRRVYIGRSLASALRRWVVVRPSVGGDPALFMTRDGRRLDKRNVARILERTARRAGLGNRRVHPHLLRHTFATHYIMNGGDPFSLQRILGHSDIKTTMIYVNLAGVGLREAHAKASPVDALFRGR